MQEKATKKKNCKNLATKILHQVHLHKDTSQCGDRSHKIINFENKIHLFDNNIMMYRIQMSNFLTEPNSEPNDLIFHIEHVTNMKRIL